HEATARGLRQAREIGDEAVERGGTVAVEAADVEDDDGLGALLHGVEEARLNVEVRSGLGCDLLVPGIEDDVLGGVQREADVEPACVTADAGEVEGVLLDLAVELR